MDESYELSSYSKDELSKKQEIVAQDLIARDARALGLIQWAVSDKIFPRILNQEITKVAWDVLKQKYKGDS